MTVRPTAVVSEALADLGANIVVVEEVDSTHLMAQRMLAQLDDEGLDLEATLIIALSQSQGIGRLDRQWSNAGQGLYLNWLRSGIDQNLVGQLPMLAAAAVRDVIAGVGITQAAIKWPNDILVSGRKIGGILVHARHADSIWATVGLGINISAAPQSEGNTPAIALDELTDVDDIETLRIRLARDFFTTLSDHLAQPQAGLDTWRRHLAHSIGDVLSIRLASGAVETGTLSAIGTDGFLTLETTKGPRTVTGGDLIQ